MENEEYRQKHIDYMKTRTGEKNSNYGNHKLAGENNPNWGKHPPEELKKMHDNNPLMKPVVQLDISDGSFIKEYESASEAGRNIKHSPGCITECCIGNAHSAHGYLWVYKDEYDKNKKYELKTNSKYKKVVQFDKDWNYIKNIF